MPVTNPTAQERLDARSRHLRFWRFAHPLARLLARLRLNYTYDDLSSIEPPYLLLSNHVLDLDPLQVGVAMGNQGYFVATENLLHLGVWTKLLMRFLCPIITQKGRMGLRSTKDLLKAIKAGASVALFPEGDRSFNGLTGPIPPATAKVARKAGKLVCVRFEGGYLTHPRWATTLRKGRLHLRLANVYDAAAMAAMTDDELAAAIERDLFEDAYARQEKIARTEGAPVHYRGRHLALGMESALFICPECGSFSTLASSDERIRCTAPDCTCSTRYLETGYLDGGRFSTITQWDAWQREELARRMAQAAPERPLFSDTVTLDRYDENHQLTWSATGTLAAFCDRAVFTPSAPNSQPMRLDVQQILGIGLFLRNTLIVHVSNMRGHYEVRGDLRFNALKYRYAYQIASEQ